MKRVLVVDDDPMVRRGNARVLKGRGWSVVEACDPVDAIQHYGQVDVVLSDLDMPNGGGERVLHESPVPVVLHSANDAGVERSGAKYVCMKPAGADALEAALLKALDGNMPSC